MEGSVRKRGSKWYYSFEAALVGGKRQRIERVGGNTKAEALVAMREAIKKYENGDTSIDSEMSVSDYFDYWVKNYVEKNLKYNTQKNYKQIIEKYIKPEVGRYKIKSVSPSKLQEVVNSYPNYKGASLSKHTVEIICTVMAGAFRKAVFPYQLIKENPMSYIEIPKYQQLPGIEKGLDVLTLNQYKIILSITPVASSFHVPLVLGFHTGLRRGEVCGLQWQDISLENKTLTVARNMQQDKNGIRIEAPKTASSFRTISLDETIVHELKQMKKRQAENRLRYGQFYQQSNFVCTKDDGSPVTPNSIKWSGAKISKEVGFHFHFHMLRHTHATMLLEAGVSPKVVQDRLGHSKITTTMDTYVHVTKEMENDAIEKFEKRLSK